jgi:hypothetical protein
MTKQDASPASPRRLMSPGRQLALTKMSPGKVALPRRLLSPGRQLALTKMSPGKGDSQKSEIASPKRMMSPSKIAASSPRRLSILKKSQIKQKKKTKSVKQSS